MRSPIFLKAALAVVFGAALTACGGGGGGVGSNLPDATKTPVVVAVTQSATTVALGKSYIASATATSQPGAMSKMSWSITKMTADAPDLTISNADCAAGTRSTKTINGINQSNWACDAVITAPATVAADSTYRLTFTGVDDAGNSGTGFRDVVVVSVPVAVVTPPAPVVSTTPVVSVTSGTDVGLGCFATGGFLKPSSKYVISWFTKSNPSGLALSLSPQADGTLSFKAPLVVGVSTVTMQCRVTDDNLQTTSSDTLVNISPLAGVAAVANTGSTVTAQTGTLVSLDGSASAAPGNPMLYFKWVQVEGPQILLSSDAIARPSFTAPAVTETTRLLFRMYVSTKFPVDTAAAVASEQSTLAVYVAPQPPLTLTVSASQSLKGGVPVVLSVAASPAAGATLYYGWTQLSGPTVSMGGTNTDKASFVSPTVVGSPVELRFAINVSRKPLSEALPSEIFTSDVVIQVAP